MGEKSGEGVVGNGVKRSKVSDCARIRRKWRVRRQHLPPRHDCQLGRVHLFERRESAPRQRVLAVQERHEHVPKAFKVVAWRQRCSARGSRGRVQRCPVARCELAVHLLCEAKVAQNQPLGLGLILTKKKVFGLDVNVHDAVRVHVPKRLQGLCRDAGDDFPRHGAAVPARVDALRERLSQAL
jgi:hypothetical protein